jgi:hypothetical protein
LVNFVSVPLTEYLHGGTERPELTKEAGVLCCKKYLKHVKSPLEARDDELEQMNAISEPAAAKT